MVRILHSDGKTGGIAPVYCEFAGTSLDTKPEDDVMTGSLFLEVDTGDLYAYDEDGEEWGKIAELGGGS